MRKTFEKIRKIQSMLVTSKESYGNFDVITESKVIFRCEGYELIITAERVIVYDDDGYALDISYKEGLSINPLVEEWSLYDYLYERDYDQITKLLREFSKSYGKIVCAVRGSKFCKALLTMKSL